MIIVTGAAGFIGSCMVSKLNNKGITDIVLVDDFTRQEKLPNIAHKSYRELVDRNDFFAWFAAHKADVEFIFHIGARTDTTEFNMQVLNTLNLEYSKTVWELCTASGIPMVYASSAATYGDGSLGYDDTDPGLSFRLKPLNPYGISKNEFDKWAFRQEKMPPRWYGLKFFNVFGPNEYHKGRMASVVFHAFRQIMTPPGGNSSLQSGQSKSNKGYSPVTLFRSHNPLYPDGGQLRDFVYVKDVIDVMYFLMEQSLSSSAGVPESGLYNLGTGKARTFLDLVHAVFNALSLPVSINFIDTPADIRDKYQYFTRAEMGKLHRAGYSRTFYSLEDAVEEYIQGYLKDNTCF